MQRRLMIIGILLFSMSASSCFFLSQQPDQTTDQAAEEVVSIYAQKENWASLPQQAERTRAVDVFYLYPTVASADDGYEVIPEEESVDSSAEEPVPDETSLMRRSLPAPMGSSRMMRYCRRSTTMSIHRQGPSLVLPIYSVPTTGSSVLQRYLLWALQHGKRS